MTWVIGQANIFGHAIGLSDIRVTINNEVEIDCLQKIYRIAGNMALGFAGSVKIGLEVTKQITFRLNHPIENTSYNPLQIAEVFRDGAKKIFKEFQNVMRESDTNFLLFSAHPTENNGPVPWAKCFVHRFRSPDFKPEIAKEGRIVSIGSGSYIDVYSNKLKTLTKDMSIMKLEELVPGGSGLGLMVALTNTLKETPTHGISTYLQTVIVGRNIVRISNNASFLDQNNEMPSLARSWEELEEILRDNGIQSILEARC